jgi:hypothetical protein
MYLQSALNFVYAFQKKEQYSEKIRPSQFTVQPTLIPFPSSAHTLLIGHPELRYNL